MGWAALREGLRVRAAAPRATSGGARSPRFARRALITFATVFAAAFAGLLFLVPQGFLNGDAPVYAERIDNIVLNDTTIHIGYYLLGILVTRARPLGTPLALNILSALAGALCVALAGSIAYTITGRLSATFAAAAALMCLPVFLENAVFAEIYVVELVFFMAAVQLALLDHAIAAGVAYGCAILITPSAVLCAPFFALLRPKLRFVLIGAATTAAVTAIAVLPHIHDYLWGGIGLLNMQAPDTTMGTTPAKELRELGGVRFALLAVFSAVGIWVVAASPKRRHLAWAIGALWLVPFLVGERYADVPVQLPLYAMLAVMAGVGLARLVHPWPSAKMVPTGAVAAFAAAVVLSASAAIPAQVGRAELVDSFHGDIVAMAADASRGDAVLAKWPTDRIAKYYLNQGPMLEWFDYQMLARTEESDLRDEEWRRLEATTAAGYTVWLVDTPQAREYLESKGYAVEQSSRFVFLAKKQP